MSYKPAGRTRTEVRCFVFVEGRIIALKITAFKVERRSSFGSQFSFCCISSTIIILLKRCYRATRRAGEHRIQEFYTDLFYYPVACFLHNEILNYLSLSHVMDTSRTFFAFLSVKHQLKRLIA